MDSGDGIEAHHLARLIERFYRVDKARSQSLGGTGLGLAIVKHVLMRHEAHLQISSAIGEGRVFRCEFPVSRVRCKAVQADMLSDAAQRQAQAIDVEMTPAAKPSDIRET